MSLDTFSVHRFCTGLTDSAGRLYLTDRVPFAFVAWEDNIPHPIKDGDTLWSVAAHYYQARPYAHAYWKILADFQPADGVRVHDPTIALPAGETLYLPSPVKIDTVILDESRRDEHDV